MAGVQAGMRSMTQPVEHSHARSVMLGASLAQGRNVLRRRPSDRCRVCRPHCALEGGGRGGRPLRQKAGGAMDLASMMLVCTALDLIGCGSGRMASSEEF